MEGSMVNEMELRRTICEIWAEEREAAAPSISLSLSFSCSGGRVGRMAEQFGTHCLILFTR